MWRGWLWLLVGCASGRAAGRAAEMANPMEPPPELAMAPAPLAARAEEALV